MIAVTITVEILNLLFCAFSWNLSVSGHSVPLFVSSFIAGSVGCLSGSTYYALVSKYDAICMKYMGIGGSLGGIIVQGLAYAQISPNLWFSRFPLSGCDAGVFIFLVACCQLFCVGAFAGILRSLPTTEQPEIECAVSPMGRAMSEQPQDGSRSDNRDDRGVRPAVKLDSAISEEQQEGSPPANENDDGGFPPGVDSSIKLCCLVLPVTFLRIYIRPPQVAGVSRPLRDLKHWGRNNNRKGVCQIEGWRYAQAHQLMRVCGCMTT